MMRRILPSVLLMLLSLLFALPGNAAERDVQAIARASGTKTSTTPDGVVRTGWSRDDVPVKTVLVAQARAAAPQEPKRPDKLGDHPGAIIWKFDDIKTGQLPEGFKAEGTNQRGPVAVWMVKADRTALSPPNVLALTDTRQGKGYNLCWTRGVKFKDGSIAVQVKAGTGKEDQGGGPIWRVRDKDNYYIARWNPLEDNFRVYYVKGGRRVQLDSARVRANASTWHTIKIEQKGDEIACSFDGKKLLQAHDKTFPEAGGVGLWTKADAASCFDNLKVSGK